ncbi:MAG: restriction endonuclease subunit S, partial [Veillonella parvula]
MSKEKRRVPKLRFPGFTEDWEQRKLSDISTKVTTKNVDVHYMETLTNSAEQGIISQVDFFDKEISNKDNINGYYIVENNDFIYNPRISTLAPVGPINRNKLNRTGIMSPLYTVFRASNVDLGFLEWYFQSSYWHRYMKLNGDSGARADRIAIKDSTFFDMPIKTPVNIKEQVLIGEILEKFNQYITLHQRKLNNLKLKKKALLQKLFPKNGERYPELRFPGFTDTWEQRKLEDICSYQSSSLTINDIDENGQYDLYDANFLIGKTNKGYMEKEYITIIKDGAGVGRTRMLPKNSIFLGTMGALTPKNSYLGFLYQLVTSANLGKICTGSTIPHIYFKDYGKLKFYIPSIIEQKVI